MTVLISMLLFAVFTLEYLAVKLGVINRFATLIPEVLLLGIAMVVVGSALVKRRWDQPLSFVVLFGVLFLIGMVGAVAEQVAPGPLVAGLRTYFKFVPLLFIAAAYRFSTKELYRIMGVFLFLVTIQVPIAFYQRFVQFSASMHTGDPVTGTVSTSSALTVVLCIAIAIIMTLYVNRKLSFPLTATLFLYFAAPTAINETKATLLLLPLATVGPFLFAKNIDDKWKLATPVFVLCGVGLMGFAVVYNILSEARWWAWSSRDISDFISTGHFQTYLYRGASSDYVPDVIGRLDSIILPVQVLAENWMQILFGLGPGNVSAAFLPGMDGAYYEQYQRYGVGMTSIGYIIWELGLLGLIVYISLFVVMWKNARALANSNLELHWLGGWWSVCVILFFLGFFYKDLLRFDEMGFLIFFFGGVVSALRNYMAESAATIRRPRPVARKKLTLAGQAS